MSARALPVTLGGYDLVGELGSGGFGDVYEARKHRLDKPVALKLLHAHLTRDPEAVERFGREARAAARFRHPHIVGVSDVGEADGVHFIEMELLEGESLKDRLARGPLSVAEAVDVLAPVCAAVAAVHDQGIVHRDIKPANVFLTAPLAGVVHPKLLDFGIARLRDGARDVTASDAFLGSVAYMSPEQMYNARDVDARADQWSLAVTAYECLTGRVPFVANSVPEAVTAVLAGSFPRPRALRPEIPESLEAAILRAMARERSERHPSVREFGAALLAHGDARVRAMYAGSLRAPEAPSSSPPPPAPVATVSPAEDATLPAAPSPAAPPRRRVTAALVVAAALAVAASGLWLATRRNDAPVTALPSAAAPAPPVTAVAAQLPAPVAEAPAAPPAAPVLPAEPAVRGTRGAADRARRSPRSNASPDAGVSVGSRGVTIL